MLNYERLSGFFSHGPSSGIKKRIFWVLELFEILWVARNHRFGFIGRG